MNRKEYNELLKTWELRYGITRSQSKRREFDAIGVTVKCKKCGKSRKRMHRHHKACDLTFAIMMPDAFAPRYLEFHPDDIDLLCSRCHKEFHFKIYDFMRNLLLTAHHKRSQWKLTKEWIIAAKKMVLEKYEEWLKDDTRAVIAKARRQRNKKLTRRRKQK